MACLECGTPGYYTDTGCCRKCNIECLGVGEHPPYIPGTCKGFDCGRTLGKDVEGDYCYDCQIEMDSYHEDFW